MKNKGNLLNPAHIVAGTIASFLLILFSLAGTFNGIRIVITSVTQGLLADSTSFFQGIDKEINFFSSLAEVRTENDLLREQSLKIESDNAKLLIEVNELRAITKQLQFDLAFDIIPARVIMYDRTKVGELVINKGSESDLKIGDIAIIDNFALGEIIETEVGNSRIRLLTSPESVVPVIGINSSTKGLVKGELGIGMLLTEVLIENELQQGELLITSGLNNKYPYGLNIGRIGSITSVESELTKTARVESLVEFNNLEKLYIIKQRQ